MNLRKLLVAMGVVFGLLIGASEAQAAKGVKKKATEHHHRGVVTHVDHKSGHFTIKSHHHSKKKKGATAKGTIHHHKYTVTSNTKFTIAHKKNKKPGTFANLHHGEHVTVASHKGHADHVTIHHKPKKSVKKKKIN